jgi:photosystem II stability/assembly factor-like uncharacterized protein
MKKISFLLLILFLTKVITTFAQCGINAGVDSTITCGGSVHLNAQPKWITLNSGTSNQALNSVYFVNNDTGYVVGNDMTTGNGAILKTTDGGTNWVQQTSGTSNTLFSIFFIGTDTGYIAGDVGTILKTTNGGTTWTAQTSGTTWRLWSVYFTDANTGYVVGTGNIGGSATILKTINGGTTWTAQTSGTNNGLFSVYFTNSNTGYAVGGTGTILKTINGGTIWTTQTSGTTNNLFSVYFTNANMGYAVGDGGNIVKTSNAGNNWTAQTSGTGNYLFSVYFLNSDTGYVVGDAGKILKTINGGTNWIQQQSGTTVPLCSVHFPDAKTGYAVGGNGTILKFPIIASYSWSPSNGLSSTNIANPVANPTATTTYIITATTGNGCIAIDSVTVTVNPLTIIGTDSTTICGDSTTLNTTTNYTGTGLLTYSWLPSTGLNNPNIANPIATINSNQTYTVTITTPNGCSATDNVNVSIIPMNAPEICIVGVDSSNKNMIVWNKPVSSAIDSFYIYRESGTTNVYAKIGAVSYNSLSVFVDGNSYPDVQSNKYKISIFDDCTLESAQSDYHKTMHLTINQGTSSNIWNLIWEPYEGFTVSSYNIYRGTSPDTLHQIGTVLGGSTTYTDNAPAGYVYYQMEVISPNYCNPTRLYNSSRSNIATNNPNGITVIDNAADLFSIYPNPANDKIEISVSQKSQIEIMNAGGQVLKSMKINNNHASIDISYLANGVYIVKVKNDKEIYYKKIIKD